MKPGKIPRELRDRNQWVVWRIEERDDKPTKVPYSVRGSHARANDPKTWASFAEAVSAASGYDGVGYVFAADDPYCGVDLDDVRNPDTGELHDDALRIIDALDSYSEISPSDTGVKIIVKAKKPGDRNRTKKTPWGGEIEMYDELRYFAITGASIGPDVVNEAQDALDAIYEEFFGSGKEDIPQSPESAGKRNAPDEEDEIVLDRAMNHSHFRKLWDGDTSKYGSDHSRADLAFCATLARITADRDQVLRLWRASGLWRKKSEREDYQRRTIDAAFLDVRPTFERLDLLNDVGNAHRLVAMAGHDLRFSVGLGWLKWDGTRWARDDMGAAQKAAEAAAERLLQAVPKMDLHDDRYRTTLLKFAKNSMNVPKIESCVKATSWQPEIRLNDKNLDAQPYRLNVLNGTLDLRTLELSEHDRGDLVTRLAPVEFDPDAGNGEWSKFIERILPDEEIRAFVQRCAGYSIAGNPVEKLLMFAHGPRDTGKSTFLNAIADVLGDYAQTSDFETFLAKKGGHGTRNDLARMRGVRFVKSSEVDEGEKMAAGVVKEITGGDTITARFLYKEHFEFKFEGVLWLAANARPKVDANDDAMWRRIVHVPFTQSIPKEEQDVNLGARLQEADARRAILKWLVDGFKDYEANGVGIPESVLAYTEEYRHEMNPLADFFDQRVERDSRGWLAWQEIKDAVQSWADEERRRVPPDSDIKASLRAYGARDERKYVDGATRRGWSGISWSDEPHG